MPDDYRQVLRQQRDAMVAEKIAEMQAIEHKYQRKLEAFAVLLDEPSVKAKSSGPTATEIERVLLGVPTLLSAVKEAIRDHVKRDGKDAHFTSITLFDWLQKQYPNIVNAPNELSNPLWRLRTAGEIEVVRQGSGRAPSVYKIK